MSKPLTRIEELEFAINALPADQYSVLRDWFWERDWAKWYCEIEVDAASGNLAFLLQEARGAKASGVLRSL